MLRTTGKDFNDFGRYSDCRDRSDEFHYFLVKCKEERCGERFPTTMSMGLCVPVECNTADFMFFIEKFTPILNSLIIPIEFKDILEQHQHSLRNTQYKSEDYLKLEISDLELVESTKRNTEVTSFGFGNFLVVVILLALTTIVIVSSVIQWRKDKAAHL